MAAAVIRYLLLLFILLLLPACDYRPAVILTPSGEGWSDQDIESLQEAAGMWSNTGCVNVAIGEGGTPVYFDRMHESAKPGSMGFFYAPIKSIYVDKALIKREPTYSIKSVLAHEIGHRVGAGPRFHNAGPNCVMGGVPTDDTVICDAAREHVCDLWSL